MPPIHELIWRRARADDAEAMAAIYNETASTGGHSPGLRPQLPAFFRDRLVHDNRMGWPTWVMTTPAPTHRVIGWARSAPMVWGGSGACRGTAESSIYVHSGWHGSGAAMRMSVLGLRETVTRHGFHTVIVSVMDGNTRSRSLIRALGMRRWALLPGVVRHGGREIDLEIWGAKGDDTAFLDRLDKADRLHRRRADRLIAACQISSGSASGSASGGASGSASPDASPNASAIAASPRTADPLTELTR